MKKAYNLETLISNVVESKEKTKTNTFVLGISGIDGSGKGYVSINLKSSLEKMGYTVHIENLDGWLELPRIRFSDITPAETFYEKGFRFEELIKKVLKPYRINGKVKEKVHYIQETWSDLIVKDIEINNVDFFILEGIFIFKNRLLPYIDYKIWIDCSFHTALERAILRNQEGLSKNEIVETYNTRFFPAQEIHINNDNPIEKADLIFVNETF